MRQVLGISKVPREFISRIPESLRGLPFGPNLTYRRTRPRKNKKNIQRHQGLRVEDVMYIVKQKDLMIDSNEIMSDIPKLNFDMISKILDMRMKTKREDRYKEEHEDKFLFVDIELSSLSIYEQATYDHLTKVDDAVYRSAREILSIIRQR